MSYLLGLTGSIGMGKSTTAAMFADQGVPVWDADAAVHRLYAPGGAGVAPMQDAFPGSVIDGQVSRDALRAIIDKDDSALSKIEAIVHPLLKQDRAEFRQSDADILLFDIPLLFETQADQWLDGIAVVSVPADIQRKRVLDRPGMTEERLDMILSRQMPDADKRARADWVIPTLTLDGARAAVAQIIADIRKEQTHA